METTHDNLAAELREAFAEREPGASGKAWLTYSLGLCFGRIARRLQRTDARLAALEARLAAVENKKLEWSGVFAEGRSYAAGELVTRSGSLWLAMRQVADERPGDPGGSWKLLVKAGSVPR